MSELSLVVFMEAGQIRSVVTAAFRLPLPDCLLWGPDVLPRIEAHSTLVESWPPPDDLEGVVIVDQDGKRLIRAGASTNFQTPYQLALFDRILAAAWPGYQIQPIAITADALSDAIGRESPPVDDSLTNTVFSGFLSEGDQPWESEWEDDEDNDLPQANRNAILAPHRSEASEAHDDFDNEAHDDDDEEPEDDNVWWVSVRCQDDDSPGEAKFRHFIGSFDWRHLTAAGPEMLVELAELPDSPIPNEEDVHQGIVLDAASRTISAWSHPRGFHGRIELSAAWKQWSIQSWIEDGFRHQLEACEVTDYVPDSDTAVLSEFVPHLAEHPDLSQFVGDIKSSFRSVVRRGFGCLAICLAVPASLAWAVSGSWKGPFAFAAGLWLVAYIGYRFGMWKMKQAFMPITPRGSDQDALLPTLAPKSKAERVRIIDEALSAARLPSYEQIVSYAETADESE